MSEKPLIGFVGQGFIGRNYADDFQQRSYDVVRYSLEPEYVGNKEKIKDCDVVFVAVPTPTTPSGFDDSYITSALSVVGKGKTAVIKSTVVPGTTKKMQQAFPDIFILHSPEFLVEKTAAFDASHPQRNIIGLPQKDEQYETLGKMVLDLLPKAPYELIAVSDETELIKYANNSFLYIKIIFANLMYDLSQSLGVDYEVVRQAIGADPRIGPSHLGVIDQSGHAGAKPGRGAGGHCFIKDFAALRELYEGLLPNDPGLAVLKAFEEKNTALLLSSGKDLDLLAGVYGPEVTK